MQFFFLSLNGVKPGVALHPYFKLFTLGGMDTKKKEEEKNLELFLVWVLRLAPVSVVAFPLV